MSVFIVSVLFNACAIQPVAWQPEQKPALTGELAINEKLKQTQKIETGNWFGAEDIVFDHEGNLYTGVHIGKEDFSDGKILKITPNGQVEIFYNAGSMVSGLHFDKDSNLIALSHKDGLISISKDKKVNILASKDENGRSFYIPNGLDIASDGMIYFTNTSHHAPYSIQFGRQLILELKKDGGLYQFNPKTNEVKTLMDGTYFGNGVVLSKDEDYLLMVETTKYRILKYWLKGAKKGQTEIFMDNLPGFPNGISIRPDGSFWIGFTTSRNDALDNIHPKRGMKKLVYGLPKFMQPKQDLFGLVLNISEAGEILKAYFDTTGKVVTEAGAVKEYKDHLYIGGDIVDYISVLKLDKLKSDNLTQR
jgi:sugar lactone lactonase YvrE